MKSPLHAFGRISHALPRSRRPALQLALCTMALCGSAAVAAVTFDTWPGSSSASNADKSGVFGSNMSGLYWQPAAGSTPASLWAVKNSPSLLYRLQWDGKNYQAASGWNGVTLTYTNGKGAPDAEGVTMDDSSNQLFVAAERDGSGSNRFSVLRYDINSLSGGKLVANKEWDLTADLLPELPAGTGDNKGPEAITWIPDTYLLANSFYDERLKAAYQPANYPNHGKGLFVVGLEANGKLYVYALNQNDGSYQRVATIASGQSSVMELTFDRDNGTLWAHCDDNCNDRNTLLAIDTTSSTPSSRKFVVKKGLNQPSSLSVYNFEGMAIASEAECVGGEKPVVWSNDSNDGSHALWRGSVRCGRLF